MEKGKSTTRKLLVRLSFSSIFFFERILPSFENTYSQRLPWVFWICAFVISLHSFYFIYYFGVHAPEIQVYRISAVLFLLPFLFQKLFRDRTFFRKTFVPLLCICGPCFSTFGIFSELSQAIPSEELITRRQYEMIGAVSLFVLFCSDRLVALFLWLLFAGLIATGYAFGYELQFADFDSRLFPYTSLWVVIATALLVAAIRNAEREKAHHQSIIDVGDQIANEMRTPLLAIKIRAQGVESIVRKIIEDPESVKALSPKKKELVLSGLEWIVDDVDSASVLVDMLLVKGRDIGEISGLEVIPIDETLLKSLTKYPFRSELEQNYLQAELQSGAQIKGSSVLLVHVVYNLLKNALFYAADNLHPKVKLESLVDSEWVEVSVWDNGSGIKAADPMDILNFSNNVQSMTGTGTGLAFCKKVVEEHFIGEIDCYSDGASYTKICVRLPIHNSP